MIKYLSFLLFLGHTLAQSIAFTIDQDEGKLLYLFEQKSNIVFKIESKIGDISSIYIFPTDSIASMFMIKGDTRLIPLNSLPLGRNLNLQVYIDNYSIIEYAKNYSTYSRAGIVGAITKIDNYDFDYHLKIGDNRDMGIVGKLKQVGAHSITYNKNYTSYVSAGITGKIESLGGTKFEYYKNDSYSEMAGYTGKLYKVGSVVIDINKPYARTEYKSGKIKAIGNINFEYFKNSYQNSASGVDGKFKSMSGEDDRIRIWFDKNKDESIADEIKKFKELLDSGAITKEEYDTKKKELLGL